MAELIVSENQNGGTVRINGGDTVIIHLQENPTTGYRWQIDAAIGLTLTGNEYSMTSEIPGGGGKRMMSFIVPASGTFQVQLSLRRSWEQGGIPQAQFGIVIQAL